MRPLTKEFLDEMIEKVRKCEGVEPVVGPLLTPSMVRYLEFLRASSSLSTPATSCEPEESERPRGRSFEETCSRGSEDENE